MRIGGFGRSWNDVLSSFARLAEAAAEPGPPQDDPPDDGVDAPAAACPAPEATRPRSLEDLAASARRLASDPEASASFARAGRRYSDNPAITGTHSGASKAELFVGDLLWAAGAPVPTFGTVGWDGAPGRHYAYAERWPGRTDLFDRVTDLARIRPGDLLVVDFRDRRGAAGAHVEVVTEVGPDKLLTAGARTRGLVEDDKYGRRLAAARPDGDHFFYDGIGNAQDARLFVLRPRT